MDGIDFVEREAEIIGLLKETRVLAVAGGDWFQRRGVMAGEPPGAHEPAGKESFADAGVGAGDEKTRMCLQIG